MSIKKTMDWLLNGVQPGMSMEELTSLGIVSEEVTDTDECRVITRTFTANDDSMTKIITLYIPKNINDDIIKDFDQQIAEAVKKEDYLLAAELQKQKKEYL